MLIPLWSPTQGLRLLESTSESTNIPVSRCHAALARYHTLRAAGPRARHRCMHVAQSVRRYEFRPGAPSSYSNIPASTDRLLKTSPVRHSLLAFRGLCPGTRAIVPMSAPRSSRNYQRLQCAHGRVPWQQPNCDGLLQMCARVGAGPSKPDA